VDLSRDSGADALDQGSRSWGSPAFVEYFLLECHRRIARELERDPASVISRAHETLDRWLANSGNDPEESRLQREWRGLLDRMPVPDLCSILRDPGEEATRLRQSSPFTGVLSSETRDRLLDECETRFRSSPA